MKPMKNILLMLLMLPGSLFAQSTVAGLNKYRTLAGLRPVTEDAAMVRACGLHAKYLIENSVKADENFVAHEQKPDLPGYTPEGARCAENSVIISQIELDSAYDFWMATPFHRIPLLNPSLSRAGGGSAKGGTWGVASVVDIFSARGPAVKLPVAYPGSEQRDIPRTFGLFRKNFTVTEYPDPLAEDSDKKAGYPVTVSFYGNERITKASGEIRQGNTLVPVWFSSPEKPSFDKDTQQNTIVLIPRDPLQPNTRYTATVRAEIDGQPFTKTWSFSTGTFPQED